MKRKEITEKIKDAQKEELESCCMYMLGLQGGWQLEKLWDFLERNDRAKDAAVIRKSTEQCMSPQLVEEKLEQIRGWFRQVDEGELYLASDGYEDYSYGYWDSEWICEYSDPDGVGTRVTLAADFAWDCLNDQRYEEALDIFERLLDLEVSAVPDDFDFLGLKELNGENITNLDMIRLALSVLYADYQLTKPEERAESLYSYIPYFGISMWKIFFEWEEKSWTGWIGSGRTGSPFWRRKRSRQRHGCCGKQLSTMAGLKDWPGSPPATFILIPLLRALLWRNIRKFTPIRKCCALPKRR